MKSRTSFLNKGFVLNDFRKYSWVAVVYTLALLFIIPLNIIMMCSNDDIYKDAVKNLLLINNPETQATLMLAVPVVLAVLLFRYLQVKISADALHSLPVKRSNIYRSHIFTGIILLILPVLITGAISILLNLFLDLGSYYSVNDVFRWMGITVLMNLVVFLACVLVGMLVGISTVQGILTYVLLFFPVGITVLLTCNLEFFIYGFMFNSDYQLDKLSPITRIFAGFNPLSERSMSSGEILIYMAICLVLFFLADYLYKIRNLENATQTIAFSKTRNVFKYGVTFCTMLLGGLYFQQTQQTIGWVVFGYLAGSLTGYVIAEIMLQKSLGFFKEVKNFKGYAVFSAIVIILMLGIRFDMIGYEKKLPPLDEIQQVYFSNSFYNYNLDKKYQTDFFSDQGNLEHIQQLHRRIIEDKDINYLNKNKEQKRSVIFIYQLSNGSTMTRGYQIAYDAYADYLKPICESEEYKKMHYDILHVNPDDVEKITLRPNMNTGSYKEAAILDPAEIEEAIAMMQLDAMNKTYELMTEQKEPWADVSILIANNKLHNYPKLFKDIEKRGGDGDKDKYIHTAWNKSDHLLENWLQEKGYDRKARILPEEISYLLVEKIENRDQWEEFRRTGHFKDEQTADDKKVKRLEIRDKSQIETCLREYGDRWLLDYSFTQDNEGIGGYIIGFYGIDNHNLDYGSFAGDNVPDFVKEFFEE
ncbi:DUF6449 domain-containing protein [Desulfoscipio sp. XC116]|uniref:DUF6449 domain-containing protein n=1 Tax=Desulfoscipio sp. XC116 TaxID=3144975 RepID=UPI00325BC2B5